MKNDHRNFKLELSIRRKGKHPEAMIVTACFPEDIATKKFYGVLRDIQPILYKHGLGGHPDSDELSTLNSQTPEHAD